MSSPGKALVRSGAGGGEEELQRLREVVRELERSLSEREEKAGDRAGTAGADGSLLTATVAINRFFLVSFSGLLMAVLGMQTIKPEWVGLELGPGFGGGGAGGGGSAGGMTG